MAPPIAVSQMQAPTPGPPPPPPPPPLTPSANTTVSPTTTYDVLTESANKIFGIENFGNTCYCNSVLQCLYFSKAFREHVIAFSNDPTAPHKRRTTVPGLKPHPFTVDPTSASISTSTGQNPTAGQNAAVSLATPVAIAYANAQAQQEARQRAQAANNGNATNSDHDSKKNQSSIGRRLSIFGSSKAGDKSGTKNALESNNASNSAINPTSPNLNNANGFANGAANHANGSAPSNGINNPTESSAFLHVDGSEMTEEEKSDTFHLPNNTATLPNSVAFDTNSPTTYSNSRLLYPALRTITLGIRQAGQNIPVVGHNDDRFATPEVRKRAALMKGPIVNVDLSYSGEYQMKESLFTSLKDIFECMAEVSSQIGVVSPAKLIQVLKRENELFRTSMHQDAHEFLNFLLNEVIDCIDRQNRIMGTVKGEAESNGTVNGVSHGPLSVANTPTSNARWVHDLFEGLLTSETKCLTCETVSRRDEQFLDLSIDIERNTSVTSCLRQFSASEMLCERNKFNCDNCGGFHEAQKRMKIKKLPKILALHLKRFKYTEDLQRNVKLFHRVVYPRYLRLFNTTDDAQDSEKLYELYAVVVHIGGGPYHGHYVSVVKTENAGWLLFDDEMVDAVDPNYVFNFFGDNKSLATAYVLFYQEVSQEQYEHDNLYSNLNILRQFPTHPVGTSPPTPGVAVHTTAPTPVAQPAQQGPAVSSAASVAPAPSSGPHTPGASVVSPKPIAASTMTTLYGQVEALEKSADTDEVQPPSQPIPVPQLQLPQQHTTASGSGESNPASRSASPSRRKSAFFSLPKRSVSQQGLAHAAEAPPPVPPVPLVSLKPSTSPARNAEAVHHPHGAPAVPQAPRSPQLPPPPPPPRERSPLHPTVSPPAPAQAPPEKLSKSVSHGYGLSRFKSTRRTASQSIPKDAIPSERYSTEGGAPETVAEATPAASKRKSRHLSFGFKKH